MKGTSIHPLHAAQARLAVDVNGKPLTQVAAARMLGVHQITLNRIENGKSPGSTDLLERMVELYGVSREYLLGEPEQIDELDLARTKMTRALDEFSEAIDLLQRRVRDVAPDRDEVEA